MAPAQPRGSTLIGGHDEAPPKGGPIARPRWGVSPLGYRVTPRAARTSASPIRASVLRYRDAMTSDHVLAMLRNPERMAQLAEGIRQAAAGEVTVYPIGFFTELLTRLQAKTRRGSTR